MTPLTEPRGEQRPGDRLRRVALAVLAVPGIAGAVLSWESMRTAAATVFDPRLAVAFPALVDALALGAALRWVASVRDGTPISGWRVTAHTAVGASILLNALAADTLGQIPWHVTAPAVWSALVELFARDMARAWQHATRHDPTSRDRIPVRLWLLAPRESATTWIRQARTGQPSAIAARVDADRIAAAVTALRVTLPGRRHRRTRREITRRLVAGTLPPGALPDVLGWNVTPTDGTRSVIQEATRAALTGPATRTGSDPTPTGADWLGPDRVRPIESVRPDPTPRDPVLSDRQEPTHPVTVRPDPDTDESTGLTPVGGPRVPALPHPVRSGPKATASAVAPGGCGVTARPADVAALRAAIADGHLPARPSVEAVRTHLKISAGYARAARKTLTTAPPQYEPPPSAHPARSNSQNLETRKRKNSSLHQTSNSEAHSPNNSATHSENHHENHDQHQQESPERILRSTTPLHVHR